MIEGVMNRSHWNRSRKSNMVSPLCKRDFPYQDVLLPKDTPRHCDTQHTTKRARPSHGSHARKSDRPFLYRVLKSQTAKFTGKNPSTKQLFVRPDATLP